MRAPARACANTRPWQPKPRRRLAKHLDEGAEERRVDRLILVADPRTLGVLRAGLTKKCAALVTGELDKDLTHIAIIDLPAHLADVLAL